MSEPGTFERIASTLGDALQPLAAALKDPGELLVQFGVAIDDDALATAAGAAAMTAAAVADLGNFVAALNVSIGADDSIGITTNGAAVAQRIGAVLNGLTNVQSAVTAALNAPSITPVQRARATTMLDDLPGLVLTRMIVDRLRVRLPKVTTLLTAIGLLEGRDVPGDPDDPMFPPHFSWRIRWDRIGQFLGDPLSVPRDAYGFGTPGFDGGLLFGLLARLIDPGDDRLDRPSITTGTGGVGAVLIGPALIVGVRDGGLAFPVRLGIAEKTSQQLALGEHAALTVDLDGNVASGSELRLSPTLHVTIVPPAGAPAASLTATVTFTAGKPGQPVTILGVTGLGGLSIMTASLSLSLNAVAGGGDLGIGVAFGGAKFSLDLSGAGGLVAALLPKDALNVPVDLAVDFSGGKLRLRGGVGLSVNVPVDLSLGPVDIEALTVGITLGGDAALPIELSVNVRTTLGPLVVIVERIGVTLQLDAPGGGGNLGPLQIGGSFKPPTGLGIELDAGPIQGGGFLEVDSGGKRYAGVLQLKVWIVDAVAYGIYEEVGGRVSFVAVLGIRFSPGIQVGFGFALTGVGGLIGVNRRANVDALRDRLASGASGNVLFCEDPVKNAPTLLGDLGLFFPPAAGGFLVGPTVQISWLSPIVRLDIGILIELPGPSKIAILGSVRAMIGLNETLALLYLRMDVLGVIDFEQQLISIDASLVASHALGVFRLTGGMAFRLCYGSNPYVLLSVGGFHPRFDPGPLNIPRLARVGASLDISVVVSIYVRLEMYVAFTSNTLQAGAKVEAGMDIGVLSAHGYFHFDAIIQFRPFHFDLEFSAGFGVEVFGLSFCSVDIDGQITGPGPVVIHAHGSIRRLFLKVSGSATFELGGHDGDHPAAIVHPVLELAPELSQMNNLRTEGEDGSIVRQPGRPAVTGVLVSPVGSLIWEQKRAPLNTIIDRLGGVPLDGQHELHLDPPGSWSTSEERDWFNPGSFTHLDLKASQTLNNATFQELPSGIRIGSQLDVKAPNEADYQAELVLIKQPTRTRSDTFFGGSYLTGAIHSMLLDGTITPAVDPGPAKVSVSAETASVHGPGATLLYAAQTPFQAFQLSRQAAGRIAVPTTDTAVSL